MDVRKETNFKIDWESSTEKAQIERKNYLNFIRKFLQDLENLNIAEVKQLMEKWKIHFVDIDNFPRVNFD